MIHQSMANRTRVSEFILLGFPGLDESYDVPVSIGLFLAYIISLFANATVILLIAFSRHLHQPMYKIMVNLAVSDLLFDTITLPKIIAKYWFGAGSIPYCVCLLQLFCVHFLGSFDAYIIMLMALDRYIAICHPLRYACIMTNRTTAILCCFFWIFAGAISAVITILDSTVPICNKNKIKSCFCTNTGLTALSCADVTFVKRLAFGLAMFVLLLPFTFIIFSYIAIIKAICSRDHFENWRKTFYTCATHLLVIGLYFIPRIFVYISNQVQLILEEDLNVLLLCLYTFVPHMANPIIYCLRTKEIRKTIARFFQKIVIKVKNPISVSVIVN
ncbi:olfactory receptor 1 [Xenopus tropicalis]|uniref:Olfactory receptor n=1 Tax=Xenopus tropicalis TaxID=8364 RepID=A0A803J4M1_XENTR|nr:olfactory receptor 1 [Xenopus tropicalis]